MTDNTTTPNRFDTETALALEVTFDGGKLTSDGGLALIAQADTQLGLCELLAQHVPEWRRGQVKHSPGALVRQRVYQIACGYEDQDDCDSLRTDPLLKLVCGRLPETAPELASQPTMSRLENAVTATACYQMATALGEVYIRERGEGGTPKKILLDFDSTDDPTHGDQEGSYYHGYYEQHMYHPLLVFDGQTGQLITAILRPDNTHASRGAVAILGRIADLAIAPFTPACSGGGRKIRVPDHGAARSTRSNRSRHADHDCCMLLAVGASAPVFLPSTLHIYVKEVGSLADLVIWVRAGASPPEISQIRLRGALGSSGARSPLARSPAS